MALDTNDILNFFLIVFYSGMVRNAIESVSYIYISQCEISQICPQHCAVQIIACSCVRAV